MRKPVLQNVGEATEEVGGFAPGALEAIQAHAAPHALGADVSGNSQGDAIFVNEDEQNEEAENDLAATGANLSEAEQKRIAKAQRTALMRDVGALGAQHGGGKTSMIALAQRVTEVAAAGIIDGADAEPIYKKFSEAADAKAHLDDVGVVPDAAIEEKAHKGTNEDSRKAQVSKLRNFIKLGNKFGKDAPELVRLVRNIHLELLAGDRESVKSGSTYSIMTQVAGAHDSRPVARGVMTEQEIRDYLHVERKEAEPKDGPGKILDALIAAKSAKKGGKERAPIDNAHLDNAIDELRAALGEVAQDRLAAHDAEEEKAEQERVAREDAKAERERARAEKKAAKKAA